MKLKMESHYSDGHHSERTIGLPDPPAITDEWWDTEVFEQTGDGHGLGADLGSCYTATVLESTIPGAVGATYEWID